MDYSRFLKGTPSTSEQNAADIDASPIHRSAATTARPTARASRCWRSSAARSVLLAADAHAPVLVESIQQAAGQDADTQDKLKVDLFKVSHHGSQNNVSSELIQLLDCPRYLVSTNGDHFCHPDRQAIARILKYGGTRPSLYFNYRTRYNEVWAREDLQEKYAYAAHYPPADRPGIVVPVLRR